jgi:septal ring factor EnvC (AmiA/AmiB activator)
MTSDCCDCSDAIFDSFDPKCQPRQQNEHDVIMTFLLSAQTLDIKATIKNTNEMNDKRFEACAKDLQELRRMSDEQRKTIDKLSQDYSAINRQLDELNEELEESLKRDYALISELDDYISGLNNYEADHARRQ